MKIAIVYYSRTGNTEKVVKLLNDDLRNSGLQVDVFKVRASVEYSPPLHLNPRLFIDTVIRKGTDIVLEPADFNPLAYSVVIVASPIWIGSIAAPIQQILKSYRGRLKHYIMLTTSGLAVNCESVMRRSEKLAKVRPLLCLNITVKEIRDIAKLMKIVREAASRVRGSLSS